MKKLCAMSIAALLATAGAPFAVENALAAKLSQSECGAIWGQADSAGAGSLTSAQAEPFVSDFSKADANADGQLSAAEFMSGCQKGLVHASATTGAGEGASGHSKAPKQPPR